MTCHLTNSNRYFQLIKPIHQVCQPSLLQEASSTLRAIQCVSHRGLAQEYSDTLARLPPENYRVFQLNILPQENLNF